MINYFLHTNSTRLAAMVIGCFFVCAGCENDINVVKSLGVKAKGIDEAKMVVSYMSQGGKTKAQLTAPLMLLSQDDYGKKVIYPQTLNVIFYTDSLSNLNIQSRLFARYGSFNEKESKIYLRDSVIVFNIKGDTLICKELTWDQTTQRFYTEKEVFISQSTPTRQRLFGIGFNSDQNLTDTHIGHVQPGSFFVVPDSSTVK